MSGVWRQVLVSSSSEGIENARLWTRANPSLPKESVAQGVIHNRSDAKGALSQASPQAVQALKGRVQDVTLREVGSLDMADPASRSRGLLASLWIAVRLIAALLGGCIRYCWASRATGREGVFLVPPRELSGLFVFPGFAALANPHRERMRFLQEMLGLIGGPRAQEASSSARLIEEQILVWEEIQKVQAGLEHTLNEQWKRHENELNPKVERKIKGDVQKLIHLLEARQKALQDLLNRGEPALLVSSHGSLLQVLKFTPSVGGAPPQATRCLMEIGAIPKFSTECLGPYPLDRIDLGPPPERARGCRVFVSIPPRRGHLLTDTLKGCLETTLGGQHRRAGAGAPQLLSDPSLRTTCAAWLGQQAPVEAASQQATQEEVFPPHLFFMAFLRLAEAVKPTQTVQRTSTDGPPADALLEPLLIKECLADFIRSLTFIGSNLPSLLYWTGAAGFGELEASQRQAPFQKMLSSSEALLDELGRRGHLHLGHPWAKALERLHRAWGIHPEVRSEQPTIRIQTAPTLEGATDFDLASAVRVRDMRTRVRHTRLADLPQCITLIDQAVTESQASGSELRQRSLLMARLEQIDVRAIMSIGIQGLQQQEDLSAFLHALDRLKSRLDALSISTRSVAFDHDEWVMMQRLNILQGTVAIARRNQVMADPEIRHVIQTAKERVCQSPHGDMLYYMFLQYTGQSQTENLDHGDHFCPRRAVTTHDWLTEENSDMPAIHPEHWQIPPDEPLLHHDWDPSLPAVKEAIIWLACAGMIWRPEPGTREQTHLQRSIDALQEAERSMKIAHLNLQDAQLILGASYLHRIEDHSLAAAPRWAAEQPSFALGSAEVEELRWLIGQVSAIPSSASNDLIHGKVLQDLFQDVPCSITIQMAYSGRRVSEEWHEFKRRRRDLQNAVQKQLRKPIRLSLTTTERVDSRIDHSSRASYERTYPKRQLIEPGLVEGDFSLAYAGYRKGNPLPPAALGRADLSHHNYQNQSLVRSFIPCSTHANRIDFKNDHERGQNAFHARRLYTDNVRWHGDLPTTIKKDLDILGSCGVNLEDEPTVRWMQAMGLIANYPEMLERPALLGLFLRATLSPLDFKLDEKTSDEFAQILTVILDRAIEEMTRDPSRGARLLALVARASLHLPERHRAALVQRLRDPLPFDDQLSLVSHLLQALPRLPLSAMHDCLRAAMWLDQQSLLRETCSAEDLLSWRVAIYREADTLTERPWNGDEAEWARHHGAFLANQWLPSVTANPHERLQLEQALARSILKPGLHGLHRAPKPDGSVQYSVRPEGHDPSLLRTTTLTLNLEQGIVLIKGMAEALPRGAYAPAKAYEAIPCLQDLVGDRSVFPVRHDEHRRRCLRLVGGLDDEQWIDLVETSQGFFLRGRFRDPRASRRASCKMWEWSKPTADTSTAYPLLAHHGLWCCETEDLKLLIAASQPMSAPKEAVYVATMKTEWVVNKWGQAIAALTGPRGRLLAKPCTRGPLSRLIRNCPDARACGGKSGQLQHVSFPSLRGIEVETVSSPGWAKHYLQGASAAFKVQDGAKEYMWYAPGVEMAQQMFGEHFTACSVIPLIDQEGRVELWMIPDRKAHEAHLSAHQTSLPKIIRLEMSSRDPDLASLRHVSTEALTQAAVFAMSRRAIAPTISLTKELASRAAPAIDESKRATLIRELDEAAKQLPPPLVDLVRLRIEATSRRWGFPDRNIEAALATFSLMAARAGLRDLAASAFARQPDLDLPKILQESALPLLHPALALDEAELNLLQRDGKEWRLSREELAGLIQELVQQVKEADKAAVSAAAEIAATQIEGKNSSELNQLLAQHLCLPAACPSPAPFVQSTPALPPVPAAYAGQLPSPLRQEAASNAPALRDIYGVLLPAADRGMKDHYEQALQSLEAGAPLAGPAESPTTWWRTILKSILRLICRSEISTYRQSLSTPLKQLMDERERTRRWILQALQSVEHPSLSRWVHALQRGEQAQEAEALDRAIQIWCRNEPDCAGWSDELSKNLEHYLQVSSLQQAVERILGCGDRPGPLHDEIQRLRTLQTSYAHAPEPGDRKTTILARYRLFLQAQMRLVVREEQIEAVEQILASFEPGANRALQFPTGFGKSKVVIALVLAVAHALKEDWTVVVTEQLLATSRRDLSTTFACLTGESILTVKIDRKALEGADGVRLAKSWSSKISELRKAHRPMLITAETLATLEVEIACRVKEGASPEDLHALRTLHQQLREGRLLLDEADAILAAIRKLIFALGQPLPAKPAYSELMRHFYDLLTGHEHLDAPGETHIAKLRYAFANGTTATLLVKQPHRLHVATQTLMRHALGRMPLDQRLVDHALGHEELPLDLSVDDLEFAKLVRQLIHRSMPIVFAGAMNREYGFSATRRIGVPFKEGEEEIDTQFSTYGEQLANTFAAACFTTPIDDHFLTHEWQRAMAMIRAGHPDPESPYQKMADHLEELREQAEAINLAGSEPGSVSTVLRRLLDRPEERETRLFLCEKVLSERITVYSQSAQRRMSAVIEDLEGCVCITGTLRTAQLPPSCSAEPTTQEDRASAVQVHAALLDGNPNQAIDHLSPCSDSRSAAEALDGLVSPNAQGDRPFQVVLNQAGIGHNVGSRAIALRWARRFNCRVAFYDPDHARPRRLLTPHERGSLIEVTESEFIDADPESDTYTDTLFYFGPADLRGVDFTIPRARFAFVPSSTATDSSIEQAVGRARRLGTLHSVVPILPHGTWQSLRGTQEFATRADWLKNTLIRTQADESRMQALRDENFAEEQRTKRATSRWLHGEEPEAAREARRHDLDAIIPEDQKLVDDQWAKALDLEHMRVAQAERQVLQAVERKISVCKAIEAHHVALPRVMWEETILDRPEENTFLTMAREILDPDAIPTGVVRSQYHLGHQGLPPSQEVLVIGTPGSQPCLLRAGAQELLVQQRRVGELASPPPIQADDNGEGVDLNPSSSSSSQDYSWARYQPLIRRLDQGQIELRWVGVDASSEESMQHLRPDLILVPEDNVQLQRNLMPNSYRHIISQAQ